MSLGFANALKVLIGKDVEVYQGDTHESLLKADKDIERKSIIRGRLVEIIDECIVLACNVNGNMARVYINSWSIQAIMEPNPGITINTIYHNAEYRKNK